MAPTRRAQKTKAACEAMKAIGFKDVVIKPTLKQLLEAKGNNWDAIEADGYSFLVNAICEEQSKREKSELEQPLSKLCKRKSSRVAAGSKEPCSSNASKRRKKCSSADDNNEPQQPLKRRQRKISADEKIEPEQPKKRPRRRSSTVTPQKKSCSSARYKTYVSDDEEDEPEKPLIRSRKRNLHMTEQMKACSLTLALPPAERNQADMLYQVAPCKISADAPHSTELADILHTSLSPERSPDASMLIGTTVKALTYETPRDDIPISMRLPGQSDEEESSLDKLDGLNSSTSRFIEGNGESGVGASSSERVMGLNTATTEAESSALEVVSSPAGDIKLTLNFERKNAETARLEDILSYVQENFVRTYQILDPSFSANFLKSFMEGACKLSASSSETCQEDIGATADENLLLPSTAYSASDHSTDVQHVEDTTMPHSELTIDQLKVLSSKSDISKGNERVEIPWINDVNGEHPQLFFYLSQSQAFQCARLDFSLSQIGKNCSDCGSDCVVSSAACPCANETGGRVYTSEGTLREDFLRECISIWENHAMQSCKGHLQRKFVKECWVKCGCNKQCGNRVVQRGITRKLQIFYTAEGKGWGLRTLEDLPSGTFVCEYVGEILTSSELHERKAHSPNSMRNIHPVQLDAAWSQTDNEEEALCLDATLYGNVARFINHRCLDANLIEIPVEVETPNHHYYRVALFTKGKVHAMEELTWDYGINFDDHGHLVKVFSCKCGSGFCRDRKKSDRSSSASVPE